MPLHRDFSAFSSWIHALPLSLGAWLDVNSLTTLEKNMLVLTRKVGESIRIGDDVVVTVLEVRPSRIRLGIVAPLSVRVQRGEHRDGPERLPVPDFLTCQSCEDSMKIANLGDLGLKAMRPAAF
jgi:carbon storage regulator CsrA